MIIPGDGENPAGPPERPGRPRARRHRYTAYRGGADPLAAPVDVRAAVDALGDRVLAGESVRDAVRALRRRELAELRARAARMRREAARRGRLDGALTRAAQKLDQALATERDALEPLTSAEAGFARARLDALPPSTAAAVRELTDYRWTSPEAEAIYRSILDELRTDVLDQQFRGLRDALTGTDPAAQAAQQAMREMLTDLNDLLTRHARGEDTTEAFEHFMAKHGQFFPEEPRDTDELIDLLARRAAAAQRMLASLSPAQRDELASLMSAALAGAPGLADQLGALGDTLRALRPGLDWQRGERVRGERPLGYGEAADTLAELADLDDLIDALDSTETSNRPSPLDALDVETVERTLGAGAARDLREWQQIERELTRQGWLDRSPDGALRLSPKALRRLGQTALRRVFSQLRTGGTGEHDLPDAGGAGEPTGSSRAWQFGDTQPLDAVRTIGNAVRRRAAPADAPNGAANAPNGADVDPARGVRLAPEDFEVVETERRTRAAVALCVDVSYSMVAEGRWAPMKQTALALSQLIATRFPQDALQIIAFGRTAEPLDIAQLAALEANYLQGTNLQHALLLAGRHLRRHPDGESVVLVVTDGEPTAHLVEGRGGPHAVFDYPPTRETVRATVAEVDALTRYGAAINVFLLGDDPGLAAFMDAVARRNGGRVFTPAADELGSYVVSDYLRARRRP